MTEAGLTYILCLQIILAFFCPPFMLGERAVFLADLFIFLWTPAYALLALRKIDKASQKGAMTTPLTFFVIFAVAFLHGMTRPELPSNFATFVGSSKDIEFQFAKEFIIAFRFFIWATAGIVVSFFNPDRVKIQRTLAACVVIAVLAMILSWASPDFRSQMGVIYGYNPYAAPWPERIYGVFRSPIEGSTALSFSFLLLLYGNWARSGFRFAVFGLILTGIFLSKTLTAFVALVLALAISLTLVRGARKLTILLSSFILLGIVVIFWSRHTEFFQLKYGNLLFRLKPWSVYWEVATSRLDLFLFGIGFQPHFSDNIYLFFFGRGGILLLGGLLISFAYWWKTNRTRLSFLQIPIVLFFIISGIAIDSLIIRPVAYLLICLGIVILHDKEPNQRISESGFKS